MANDLLYSSSLDVWEQLVQRTLLRHIEQPICNVQPKLGLNAIQQRLRDEGVRWYMGRQLRDLTAS